MGGTIMNGRIKIDSYLQSARDSFDGKPWYGSSILKILNALPVSDINTVPPGFQKSAATLLRHMLAWRSFTLAKLQGDADYRIPESSKMNWDYSDVESPEEWQYLIKQLHHSQDVFLSLLDGMSDEVLSHKVAGSVYSKEYLIRGIIQHDIFHLGQIALLSRAISDSEESNS